MNVPISSLISSREKLVLMGYSFEITRGGLFDLPPGIAAFFYLLMGGLSDWFGNFPQKQQNPLAGVLS